jgi:aryl-alcohol dehydrogenase-like predicted oxidoreductase
MTFGGQGFWKVMGGLQQDAATALVKRAFDAGVNFIDTANVYSVGESETLTGNAIKSLGLPRDELVVATKATGVMSETAINARGATLRQAIPSCARFPWSIDRKSAWRHCVRRGWRACSGSQPSGWSHPRLSRPRHCQCTVL